jgi:hypothetical protein
MSKTNTARKLQEAEYVVDHCIRVATQNLGVLLKHGETDFTILFIASLIAQSAILSLYPDRKHRLVAIENLRKQLLNAVDHDMAAIDLNELKARCCS